MFGFFHKLVLYRKALLIIRRDVHRCEGPKNRVGFWPRAARDTFRTMQRGFYDAKLCLTLLQSAAWCLQGCGGKRPLHCVPIRGYHEPQYCNSWGFRLYRSRVDQTDRNPSQLCYQSAGAERKAGLKLSQVFPHLRHLDLPVLSKTSEIDFSRIDLVFAHCHIKRLKRLSQVCLLD